MNYITSSAEERINRWPFLAFEPREPDDIDWESCWDDCVPEGWRVTFGEMMWDEIAERLKNPEDLHIEDVKEKWGELTIYYSCSGDSHEAVGRIFDKYRVLSSRICINCGKSDCGITKHGWVVPICEDCYSKSRLTKGMSRDEAHEKYVKEFSIGKMPDVMRWRTYSPKVKKWEDHEQDISETADKIREHWREL